MKTILVLTLLAASFAMVPAAHATCDPIVGQICTSSYTYGASCDDGGAGNDAYAYNSDANGVTAASVGTGCNGHPGAYSASSIGAGVLTCDPSNSCNGAGASWFAYSDGPDSYCESEAYTEVGGSYTPTSLPLCDAAGAPPGVPALLP